MGGFSKKFYANNEKNDHSVSFEYNIKTLDIKFFLVKYDNY